MVFLHFNNELQLIEKAQEIAELFYKFSSFYSKCRIPFEFLVFKSCFLSIFRIQIVSSLNFSHSNRVFSQFLAFKSCLLSIFQHSNRVFSQFLLFNQKLLFSLGQIIFQFFFNVILIFWLERIISNSKIIFIIFQKICKRHSRKILRLFFEILARYFFFNYYLRSI